MDCLLWLLCVRVCGFENRGAPRKLYFFFSLFFCLYNNILSRSGLPSFISVLHPPNPPPPHPRLASTAVCVRGGGARKRPRTRGLRPACPCGTVCLLALFQSLGESRVAVTLRMKNNLVSSMIISITRTPAVTVTQDRMQMDVSWCKLVNSTKSQHAANRLMLFTSLFR